MNWPTWNQAAIAAALSGMLAVALRRRDLDGWRAAIGQAATEFALIAGLYSVWRVARKLPLAQDEGAVERARQIVAFQEALHLPSELSLQRWFLEHDTLARWANTYYATLHVPMLLGFLVWLFVRHREHFARWRNALAILTGFCLVIRFIRVAPPRFLGDLGYVDLSTRYGLNIYGPVGTGVSDQFAAMPSIHVGWAAVVSFGVVAASTSRWRWLALLHVIITFVVVSATGNHWWMDGIVAVALLATALRIDTVVRRRRVVAAPEAEAAVPEPAMSASG